jgi:hypothetical protein
MSTTPARAGSGKEKAMTRPFARAAAAVLAVLAAAPATAAAQDPAVPADRSLTVHNVDVEQLSPDASGWGRTVSSPAGIDCPAVCSATFPEGTPVALHAEGAPGFKFESWLVVASSGDTACDSGPDCIVTMGPLDADVEARLRPAAKLTAVPAGYGKLTITPVPPDRPADATCELTDSTGVPGTGELSSPLPQACTPSYITGTKVLVTAIPNPGGRLVGWSDYTCAAASPSCQLTLTGDSHITAFFDRARLIIRPGTFGRVEVKPPGGDFCTFVEDAPCARDFRAGTFVTLRREHGAPGNFWSGPCKNNSLGRLDADTCDLRVDGNEVITAGTDRVLPDPVGSSLTVVLSGNKRGVVKGVVVGRAGSLSCPPACAISDLNSNDNIRLTATARAGSKFTGWSYRNAKTTPVTVDAAAQKISATFAPKKKAKKKKKK